MEGLILLFVILFFYFFPAIIAGSRTHNNTASITALNLFLGWTLIGWVISFVWALSKDVKKIEISQD